MKTQRKKRKGMTKSQRGITLVALVVTIVVLIILATISVNIIFGDEGILERAIEGQEKQKKAEAREKVQMMITDYLVEREISKEEYKLITYMNKQVTKGKLDSAKEETKGEEEKVIVETNGYEIEIDVETLEVTVAGEGKTPQEPEDTTASVTGVTLNKQSTAIRVGETETLTATVSPETANNKKVMWSSDKISIATVDESGKVTALAVGIAIITVTTEDGSKTATCEVTVEKPLVTTLTSIQTKTVEAEDRLGNPITIPGGFKYVTGELVQDGIVIEDGNITTYADGSTMGNQFVWVPVSNVDGGTDATKHKMIKVEDETTKEVTEVEITLGRYETFSKTAEPKQLGANYGDGANDTYRIANNSNTAYMKELNTSTNPEGVVSNGTDGKNAIYQTLGNFVTSVRDNHGYYIARYEASYESGSGTDYSTYKMASKKSTTVSQSTTNDWANTPGRLWHWITQINASKVCRNMYNLADEESDYVVSDLINSYMWDTALIFITKVEDESYHDDFDGNGTLRNAGATTDVKCNIYDMKGNLREWTTEYCTYSNNSVAYPCTYRGGGYVNSSVYTSNRLSYYTTNGNYYYGFRAALYVM